MQLKGYKKSSCQKNLSDDAFQIEQEARQRLAQKMLADAFKELKKQREKQAKRRQKISKLKSFCKNAQNHFLGKNSKNTENDRQN